jgi:hypothetical protein
MMVFAAAAAAAAVSFFTLMLALCPLSQASQQCQHPSSVDQSTCVDLRYIMTLKFDSTLKTTSRRESPVPQLNCTNCVDPYRRVKCVQISNGNGRTRSFGWQCTGTDKYKPPSQICQARVVCEPCRIPQDACGDDRVLVVPGSCHLTYEVPEADNWRDACFLSLIFGVILVGLCVGRKR